MDSDEDWNKLLQDHPIFALPRAFSGPAAQSQTSLELSSTTLQSFTHLDPTDDGPTPSGRRQVMVLKDADLVVAAGKEIRMASLGDLKLSQRTKNTYKTLHSPNIQFEIHQIALNPSGKLLAVAGAFQVAVVVLPRAGFTRLVPDIVDCKSVQVGQFYHGSKNPAPVAKIEWHPWGDAGSTLLVMTSDGKLREYDISVDTEEPQQVLSFVPEKKTKSFIADDGSEREVVSFVLGKGRADWGPLTMYALMKSGDIYAICPYMPKNCSIPSSYVHSLECFIAAKQEFLAQGTSTTGRGISTLYDYQRKFITALTKQLPAGTVFPAASRTFLVHPPTTIKSSTARQGPFLLQPSPRTLDGSDGGDATDISYLAFGTDEDLEEDGGETEHLGVLLVSYQDGKVDVFLDVEKVEARWDVKQFSNCDLPMLAVYETIDLGLVSTLNSVSPAPNQPSSLELLTGNHPTFLTDPIHDDIVYVYHAFGVHALDIGPVLQGLSSALRADDEAETSLMSALQQSAATVVKPILTTFSVERRCSNPVIAVAIPNDVYLTYSVFILTSVMRVSVFPLNLRSESPRSRPLLLEDVVDVPPPLENSPWLTPVEGQSTYVSLLAGEPYKPSPLLASPSGLPPIPKLSLPPGPPESKELTLTPDTLRYIATTVAQITGHIHEAHLAYRAADSRASLQKQELIRLSDKCKEMETTVQKLKGVTRDATEARIMRIEDKQKSLLARLDRMLQSLMERASPALSEHETKWFEELRRMKEEIMGAGRYDEGSLIARTRLLEQEYVRLTPALKNLLEKEKLRNDKLVENSQQLGFSQAFEYGERSNLERTRISCVKQDIVRLAGKLDVPLGRVPSIQ